MLHAYDMKFFLKLITTLFFELLVFVVAYVAWHHQGVFSRAEARDDEFAEAPAIETTEERFFNPALMWKEAELETSFPQSFELPVPFTSQAPNGNWDEPWQNFCEEAVILMTARFHDGYAKQTISPSEASRSLLSLMRYEQKKSWVSSRLRSK